MTKMNARRGSDPFFNRLLTIHRSYCGKKIRAAVDWLLPVAERLMPWAFVY